MKIPLNNGAVRDRAVLGNDDDAIADVVEGMVEVFGFARGSNDDIVADARVLIDDGVLDPRVLPDADARFAKHFVFNDRGVRLVIVPAQKNDAVETAAITDNAADADDRMADAGVVDDA